MIGEILSVALLAGVVIVGILLALVVTLVVTYNKLVVMRNHIRGSGQIMRNLQEQRETILDKITSLVAKGSRFENKTLQDVMQYRKNHSTKQLFLWVTENYPVIKGVEEFAKLKDEVVLIEKQVTDTKASLAESVFDYKNAIEVFPTSIVAGWFGFNNISALEQTDKFGMRAIFDAEGSTTKGFDIPREL